MARGAARQFVWFVRGNFDLMKPDEKTLRTWETYQELLRHLTELYLHPCTPCL